MKTTANGLKSTMLKKKLSNTISTSTNVQPLMNNTSVSNNEDKLAQLKQKLQKQRQNMRKSGRRFKEQSSSNEIEIQTNSQDIQVKQQKQCIIQAQTKKPITSSTSSTSSNLYSFQSLKTTAQTRANRMFLKRPSTKKSDILPIQNSSKSILNNDKSTTKVKITPKKQTVNLMQLSQVIPTNQKNVMKQQQQSSTNKFVQIIKKDNLRQNHFANDILANSKVFQSAIQQQKLRNKQVQQFLKQVGLEQFSQNFISLGFDQIDTLIEVQVDDLNSMMMRARQQQKLMSLIKSYKQQNGIQSQPQPQLQVMPRSIKQILTSRPLSSHPKSCIATQPSQNPTQSSRLLHSTFYNMSQSTLVNKSSIFYMMGGQQWSIQSQIRKACSGCFRQAIQMQKRGDCYYCQHCGQADQLDISLDMSMVRNYMQ